MSVCLAITAKNEAAVIGRCIESFAPYVDALLVVDTGSTDDTYGASLEAIENSGLQKTAYANRDWVDFATTQSETLKMAREMADYVWVADADEVLNAPADWELPALAADGYDVCRIYGGDWEVWGTRLFNSAKPWVYQNPRHAVPVCEGAVTEKLIGVDVENKRDGHHGQQDLAGQEARFLTDARLFLEQLGRNPKDSRSAYYLAQSLHDAKQPVQAMMAYQHRAAMRWGFEEERYIAALQVARYMRRFGYGDEETRAAFCDAMNMRENRAEAFLEFSHYLFDQADFATALYCAKRASKATAADDLFLVQRSAHTWRPWVALARAHKGLGDTAEARDCWKRVLTYRDVAPMERRLAEIELAETAA